MSLSYKILQKVLTRSDSIESASTGMSSNLFIDTSGAAGAVLWVVKLGIQAPPGFTFQINGGGEIKMGHYGIYELDVTDLGVLTEFRYKPSSLPEGQNAYLDIVYCWQGGAET